MAINRQRLLEEYKGRIRNLDTPDEFGLDEELVLSTRESIAYQEDWTAAEQAEIERLDEQLAARWQQFEGTLPWHLPHPREHWWWFLHEGPQVREQAKEVDTEPTQA